MARYTKPAPTPGWVPSTDRDEAIIRAVYRYRFLTTDHVMLLTNSTSRSALNRRLSMLWGNNYLDRPEIQKEVFAYAEKRPTIHALGRAGAKWLTNNHGIRFPDTVDWRQKNRNIKGIVQLKHTLGVTGMMLRIESNLATTPGFRFVDRDTVWFSSPRYSERQENPFRLPTQYDWFDGTTIKKGTNPDYIFVVGDGRGEDISEVLYFPEYDNDTEDYVRKSPWQSSIVGKFFGYADAYNRHLVEQLYGYERFRVPFVIQGNNVERVERMVETYQTHAADRIPPGAFIFTTEDKLFEQGFLAPIWLDGRGETVSLHAGAVPSTLAHPQATLLNK